MNRLDSRFNLRFMLALDCYMPSVARQLFKSCREDIRMFGFEYAQRKWEKFIIGSLTGGCRVEDVDESNVLSSMVQGVDFICSVSDKARINDYGGGGKAIACHLV